SYGIREGVLYEQMPGRLRDRDPLIEACRYSEAKDARQAGFGKKIFNFVLPLFEDPPEHLMRLIKAACLLHDVNWRAHPDYRSEVCFDTATRANLGGLKHSERVFLGSALMYRYRNQPEGTRFDPLIALLTEGDSYLSKVLGKAMRLGAMLWDTGATAPARLEWQPKTQNLILHLSEDKRTLNGEVVEARFASLAHTMGANHQIAIAQD
ncbi:MAG: exopolyphosphatase, partial [Pseudomonadota bacterium]